MLAVVIFRASQLNDKLGLLLHWTHRPLGKGTGILQIRARSAKVASWVK